MRMEKTKHAVPAFHTGQQRTRRQHSEDALREMLRALSKPMAASDRRRQLKQLCMGLRVWTADEWDPHWRHAAQRPDVAHAVGEGARLAAADFLDGVHIPREAAEQLDALEWPRQRTDFLAYPMPGFCHASAAVAFALACAARPGEAWVILVSQLHAAVLSLSSATLVDFNAAAMARVAQVDATAYLQQLILSSEAWALYPSLELYLDNLRPAIMHTRRMPMWAQPSGCDHKTFERLRRDGKLDDDFARGQAMLVPVSER